MNLRIESTPIGSHLSDANAQRGSGQTGRFRGEIVQVRTGGPGLGAAAEEISFAASERVEKKTHADRNIKTGARASVLAAAQITEYLQKTRQEDAAKDLDRLARQLLQSNPQDPGRLGRQSPGFRAPTEQFMLLQYARHLGAAEGAPPELLERIDDALADLEANFGKVIQANIATIDQASRYGESQQEVQAFQGSVQVVLGKPTLAQALQEVLRLAGEGGRKLESGVANLMDALGACLAATRSNADKVLLETLVTDLYHLKSLKTLMEDCKRVVQSLRRQREAASALSDKQRKKGKNPEDDDDADR